MKHVYEKIDAIVALMASVKEVGGLNKLTTALRYKLNMMSVNAQFSSGWTNQDSPDVLEGTMYRIEMDVKGWLAQITGMTTRGTTNRSGIPIEAEFQIRQGLDDEWATVPTTDAQRLAMVEFAKFNFLPGNDVHSEQYGKLPWSNTLDIHGFLILNDADGKQVCFVSQSEYQEARANLFQSAPTMALELEKLRAENEDLKSALARSSRLHALL